jgi:WD40 repeat protein
MKNILRLFVSSTFQDFQKERRKLMCEIFPKLEEKLKAKDIGFLPIDLRWGVTQEAARLGRTMEICHAEVERACTTEPPPDFLLLLGHRYGWRPLPAVIATDDFEKFKKESPCLVNGYELDKNTTKTILGECANGIYRLKRDKDPSDPVLRGALDAAVIGCSSGLDDFRKVYYAGSATHQEFEIAKRQQAKKAKIMVYLREDAAASDSSSPDQDAPEELQRMGLGVEAFRQSVVKYNTEQDDRTDIYFAWDQLTAALGKLDPSVVEQGTKASEAFIKERASKLCGRGRELKVLREFSRSGTGCMAVVGESGSGKSSLMAKLMQKPQKAATVQMVYRFIGVDEDCGSERALLASIIKEVGGLVPPDPREYESALKKCLEERTGKPLLLVLDALNQLTGESRLNWLHDLPSNTKAVVSLIDTQDTRFKQSLKIEDVTNPLAVVLAHLNGFDRKLTVVQKKKLKASLSGKTCLHLTLIAGMLRDIRSGDEVPSIPNSVPAMLDHLHTDMCQRHKPELVNRIFSLLLVPKHGVSEIEVKAVLENDPTLRAILEADPHHPLHKDDPLPPVLWSSLWEDIKPYVAVRQRHGEELLAFMHSAFIGHFTRSSLQEETAQLLSDYYLTQTYSNTNTLQRDIDHHILEETIGVLVKAQSDQSRESIEKLLTDLEYIQQRGAAGQVYELLDDYNHASKEYHVPKWEQRLILEKLSQSDKGKPDWSYTEYALDKETKRERWPEHGSHAETCLRMRFSATAVTSVPVDLIERRGIRAFYLFARKAADAIARAADDFGLAMRQEAVRVGHKDLVQLPSQVKQAFAWVQFDYDPRKENEYIYPPANRMQIKVGKLPSHDFDANSRFLVTAGKDGRLAVWDLVTGTIVCERCLKKQKSDEETLLNDLVTDSGLGCLSEREDLFAAIVFNPRENMFHTAKWLKVTNNGKSKMEGLRVQTFSYTDSGITLDKKPENVFFDGPRAFLSTEAESVWILACRKDNPFFAFYSEKHKSINFIQYRDTESTKIENTNQNYDDIKHIIVPDNSDYLFTYGEGHQIGVWNLLEKKLEKIITLQRNQDISKITATPDGRWLLVALDHGGNEPFLLIDVRQEKDPKKIPWHVGSSDCSAFALSADARLGFFAFSLAKEIFVLDLDTNKDVRTLVGHNSKVIKMKLGKGGRNLLSLDDSGSVIDWNLFGVNNPHNQLEDDLLVPCEIEGQAVKILDSKHTITLSRGTTRPVARWDDLGNVIMGKTFKNSCGTVEMRLYSAKFAGVFFYAQTGWSDDSSNGALYFQHLAPPYFLPKAGSLREILKGCYGVAEFPDVSRYLYLICANSIEECEHGEFQTKRIRSLKMPAFHVSSYACSPDGETFLLGSSEGKLIFFSRRMDNVLASYDLFGEPIRTIEITTNGLRVFITTDHWSVLSTIKDLEKAEPVRGVIPGCWRRFSPDSVDFIEFCPCSDRRFGLVWHQMYGNANTEEMLDDIYPIYARYDCLDVKWLAPHRIRIAGVLQKRLYAGNFFREDGHACSREGFANLSVVKDGCIKYICPWCDQENSLIYQEIYHAKTVIGQLQEKYPLAYQLGASRSLNLPDDAWEKPGLRGHCCSHCQNPIRFNPWIVGELSSGPLDTAGAESGEEPIYE